MRTIKAAIILICSLVMLISAAHDAAAAGAPTFTDQTKGDVTAFQVETVRAKAGDQVELAIRIKNSPGITAARVQISFGEELKLIGVTSGNITVGSFMGPQKMDSPVYINWVHGTENISGDYLFAKLTFAVADNAAACLHAVSLSYDPDDVYGVNPETYVETNVSFAVVNGGIRVEGKAEECSHSYAEYTSNQDASCMADGTKTASCTICGRKNTVVDEGSALGHDFSERIEDGAHLIPGSGSNCQVFAEYYYDCVRCDTMGTETFLGDRTGNHQLGTEYLWENGTHFRKCIISGCDYTGEREACFGTKDRCQVCGNKLNESAPTGESQGTAYEGMAEDKGEEGGELLLILLCSVFFLSLAACVVLGILKARKR